MRKTNSLTAGMPKRQFRACMSNKRMLYELFFLSSNYSSSINIALRLHSRLIAYIGC